MPTDISSLPPMVPPPVVLTVTPGTLGSGTSVTASISNVAPAVAGTRYYGFSALEDAGNAASFAIRNNINPASGNRIDIVSLAPGESTSDWYGPEGIDAASGISVEWLSGSCKLVVKYKVVP